jgi:hypothetical protein
MLASAPMPPGTARQDAADTLPGAPAQRMAMPRSGRVPGRPPRHPAGVAAGEGRQHHAVEEQGGPDWPRGLDRLPARYYYGL